MYERVSETGRLVMQLACQEAFRFNHHYTIGGRDTLHCLFAILKIEPCGATALLTHLLGNVAQLRSNVHTALAALPSEDGAFMGHLGLTPAMRRAVEQAIADAQHQGVEYVRTEHLLLGLSAASNDPAAQLLSHVGVLRDDLLDHLWVLERAIVNPRSDR
jgi:ATP-dependent Clp protease ATP-binding subunit ClpA